MLGRKYEDIMAQDKRIGSLDGLNGLACLPIILVHYYGAAKAINNASVQELPFSTIFGPFYKYGYIFVYLFFWISGFLCESRYRDNIKSFTVIAFLKKRMHTLYPMAFCTITIGIGVSILDQILTSSMCVQKPIRLLNIFLSYTLMQVGWSESSGMMPYGSGTWFICVLFLCYILFWIISNIFHRYKYLLSFVMFLLGWVAFRGEYDIPFFTQWNGSGYCAFFGGVLLYELLYGDFKDEFGIIFKCISHSNFFSLIFLVFLCMGLFLGDNIPILMLVVYSPIVICYTLEVSWIRKVLELKPFQWLGNSSMSIYMSHVHIINLTSIVLIYFGLNYSFKSITIFIIDVLMIFCIGRPAFLLLQKNIDVFYRLWK